MLITAELIGDLYQDDFIDRKWNDLSLNLDPLY